MIAYEFYYRDAKGDDLIGILPERRKNSERINKESIMKWIRMVLGDNADIDHNNVYFIQVDIHSIQLERCK
jgi:hypothetical protein